MCAQWADTVGGEDVEHVVLILNLELGIRSCCVNAIMNFEFGIKSCCVNAIMNFEFGIGN